MRILVSDYSGHAFPAQLSRALATRGHEVLHIYSESFQTPKGKFAGAGGPSTFRTISVRTREEFAKANFVKRRRQEIETGRLIGAQVAAFRPDIVLSGNAPVDAQRKIQGAARAAGARFIFWAQDLYAEAMLAILPRRIGPVGTAIGLFYRCVESRLFRRSDHVVAISPHFAGAIQGQAGIDQARIGTIENWAPLEEMPLASRDNRWARTNLPAAPFRAVYAGTLGLKHNPDLLLALAKGIEDIKGELIVFSEGPAAEYLKRQAVRDGIGNLRVSGWLCSEVLPFALAGADVLVAVLEREAGAFSVPSKVMTYLCAGRPILAAIPAANLAARTLRDTGAGAVVEPDDARAFVAAARALAANPELRREMGSAGRAHAELAFDVETIASRFESIFAKARAA